METTTVGNLLSKLTPEAVKKIASDQLARDQELRARDEARKKQIDGGEFEFAPITYADADEESRELASFQLQPDAEAKLRDHCERLFELQEREAAMLEVLKTATEEERRTLLGYETKVLPSLPGIADSYTHVPGNLETVRAKIADLEAQLPRLKFEAAKYAHIRASFRHPAVIARERSERLTRSMIVAGKTVQRRGPQ
jgi:hypothetical protein